MNLNTGSDASAQRPSKHSWNSGLAASRGGEADAEPEMLVTHQSPSEIEARPRHWFLANHDVRLGGGVVHASEDGLSTLCTSKRLRHGKLVDTLKGYTICQHPSGKCMKAIRHTSEEA